MVSGKERCKPAQFGGSGVFSSHVSEVEVGGWSASSECKRPSVEMEVLC